jgi:hypothetical protein
MGVKHGVSSEGSEGEESSSKAEVDTGSQRAREASTSPLASSAWNGIWVHQHQSTSLHPNEPGVTCLGVWVDGQEHPARVDDQTASGVPLPRE